MNKSKILPNRAEYRATFRKFKKLRGLGKKKAKGAFGRQSQYLIDYKALKIEKLQKKEVK